MKHLLLFIAAIVAFSACGNNSPKLYKYNDDKLPDNYTGPFGTSIGENTTEEFEKIIAEKTFRKETEIDDDQIYTISLYKYPSDADETIRTSESLKINYYTSDDDMSISSVSLNDTVVHVFLSYDNVEYDFKKKYGEGVGEFQLPAEKPKTLMDGYSYTVRIWQNKHICAKYKISHNQESEPCYLPVVMNLPFGIYDTHSIEFVSFKKYDKLKSLIDSIIKSRNDEYEKIEEQKTSDL